MADSQDNSYKLRIEEILREEVRILRELTFQVIRWGVAVMLTLHTAIFFARREIADDLVAAGKLTRGLLLPLDRFIVGTLALTAVAWVFGYMTDRVARRYLQYGSQLPAFNISGIRDEPTEPRNLRFIKYFYYAFPVLDLIVRGYVAITLRY